MILIKYSFFLSTRMLQKPIKYYVQARFILIFILSNLCEKLSQLAINTKCKKRI